MKVSIGEGNIAYAVSLWGHSCASRVKNIQPYWQEKKEKEEKNAGGKSATWANLFVGNLGIE